MRRWTLAIITRLMWFCMQLYLQSLDNERRRMMSRPCCAGPSVPEGVTSTGCANTVPTIRTAGIAVQRQPRRAHCSSPLSEGLGSVDACFKSPSL